MGIRESINKHPSVACGVVGAFLLTLTVFVYATQRSRIDSAVGEAAYTNDDGKTWFVDVADRITPFQKDGRPAVGAALFSNDNGTTKFVGYLYRYSDAHLKRISVPDAARLSELPAGEQTEIKTALEIKAPNSPAGKWTNADSPAAHALMNTKSPDGRVAITVEP